MTYHEVMVKPMREEVTRSGVQELRSVGDVDAALGPGAGTVMVFVNSVCGCAAGGARPALALALQHAVRPHHLYPGFAARAPDRTARARSSFADYRPTPPPLQLLRPAAPGHSAARPWS